MVANKCLLVEHGAIAAEKAPPLVLLDSPRVVSYGVADVEDLTVVVHICVVPVGLPITAETVHIGGGEDHVSSRGQSNVLLGLHRGKEEDE